jgi:O-antigen ligase
MLIGALAIGGFGLTGLAGPLERAAPHLAVLFSAGALWTIGYVAARHRGTLDITWSALIWSSTFYCAWMFFVNVMAGMSAGNGTTLAQMFETPGQGALLFSLLALVGWGRLLHVVKQMDAEALARSQMVERLLRDGLGALLLVGLALSCLALTGSQVGVILAASVLIFHAWWDSLSITTREHRGILVRFGAQLAPIAALGLAAWGIGLAWTHDENVIPGAGVGPALPHVQRLEAFMQAWMQQPAFGHGLGSIDAASDRATTLWNAKAMLAPGHAQNVFVTWMVETGIVGLVALALVLLAMHARIFAALGSRRTPRTFLRLSVAGSLLLLLHGVSDSSIDLPSVVWVYSLLLGAACGLATGSHGPRHSNPLSDMTAEM